VARLLADIASYQGALKPADVKAAGFDIFNLKTSHGLGQHTVHPDVAGWVSAARTFDLDLSTFHWLAAGPDGTAQADYAYTRLGALDLLYGTAHFVDVEEPGLTLVTVRDYLTQMTDLLQRPVGLYTGDWWWAPKNWNVTDLTPYLMAAPNSGYPGSYPGDTDPAWQAGWGGWTHLSVMQYAVAPLSIPGQPKATIKVSKSALRDPAVWNALTLGRPGMSTAPATLLSARKLWLTTFPKMDPLSMGIVGDDSHAKTGTSYHLGRDALKADAYSIVESARDKNGLTNNASALDVGYFTSGSNTLRTFSVWLVAQCAAGTPGTADIREVIYSPDGKVVKRWDRLKKRSTGPISHLIHTHISYFRDSADRDKTALFIRYFRAIGLLEDTTMPDVQDVLNGLHGDLMRGPDFKATKDFPAGESGLHRDVRGIAEAAVKPLTDELADIKAAIAALHDLLKPTA
jgi:Glycosyl hydrolases family 25